MPGGEEAREGSFVPAGIPEPTSKPWPDSSLPTSTGSSFMPEQTETPRPVEQSEEQQIQALMGELDRQNDQLSGRLLAKLPISAQDQREASFFTKGTIAQTGPNNDRHVEARLFGIHPDLGPIYLTGPLAESLKGKISQTLESDSDVMAVKPEGDLEGLIAQANANGEANSIVPVREGNQLADWARNYQSSKENAERVQARLEAAKRIEATRKAYEIVTGKRGVKNRGLTF